MIVTVYIHCFALKETIKYNIVSGTVAITTYSHKLSQLYLKIISLIGVCFLIFSALCVL